MTSHAINVLNMWANKLEAHVNKNPTIQEFLMNHELAAEMLLCIPNKKIDTLLVFCTDFDISEYPEHTKRLHLLIITLMLKSEDLYKKISFRIDDNLISGMMYRTLEYENKYNDIYLCFRKLFAKYCRDNHSYIQMGAFKLLSKKFLGYYVRIDSNYEDIINYHFDHKINIPLLVTEIIDNTKINQLEFVINKYGRKENQITIDLNNIQLAGDLTNPFKFKMCYMLEQNFEVKNKQKYFGYNSFIYESYVVKQHFIQCLMWMDEQQRFTKNKKDTTLLDTKPISNHIRNYLCSWYS